MADATRRASGSGSLAASYAFHSHAEQRAEQEAAERGQRVDTQQQQQFPVRLPTDAGVAHIPHNLTHGIVVDDADKKRTRFENEKYLRSHPELGVLIQDFIGHVLEQRPDDIEAAAVEFFVREGDRRSNLQQQQQQQTTAQQ